VAPPPPVVVTPPPSPEPLPPLPVEAAADSSPVPTTRLEFVAAGDEEEVISRWNDDEDVWEYEVVCVTPCTIDVPNGMHEFMAGDHRTFQVFVLGGVQRWRVEDNNQAGIGAGTFALGLMIWILSYGSAEQEAVGDGYLPVGQGIGVQPSVFTAEDGLGGRLWGLGLGLRY
jgi:hypothetical protein